jgi:hypothetical protein
MRRPCPVRTDPDCDSRTKEPVRTSVRTSRLYTLTDPDSRSGDASFGLGQFTHMRVVSALTLKGGHNLQEARSDVSCAHPDSVVSPWHEEMTASGRDDQCPSLRLPAPTMRQNGERRSDGEARVGLRKICAGLAQSSVRPEHKRVLQRKKPASQPKFPSRLHRSVNIRPMVLSPAESGCLDVSCAHPSSLARPKRVGTNEGTWMACHIKMRCEF